MILFCVLRIDIVFCFFMSFLFRFLRFFLVLNCCFNFVICCWEFVSCFLSCIVFLVEGLEMGLIILWLVWWLLWLLWGVFGYFGDVVVWVVLFMFWLWFVCCVLWIDLMLLVWLCLIMLEMCFKIDDEGLFVFRILVMFLFMLKLLLLFYLGSFGECFFWLFFELMDVFLLCCRLGVFGGKGVVCGWI